MTPTPDRKDEELDRMLAELHLGYNPKGDHWQKCRDGVSRSPIVLPRYTQSLDECARVEAGLRPCDLDAYVENVGEIVREYWLRQGKDVPGFSDQSVIFAHMTATARQRTIALISTLQAKT